MGSQPRRLFTFHSLVCISSLLTVLHATSHSRNSQVRYLTYPEVENTIHLFADSGLPGSEIVDSTGWDTWIRGQDRQVRERIDRGVEDSISNFIAYGTSYTNLPRLQAVETSITDSGDLSPEASARLRALVAALESHSRVERVQLVRQFLAQKGIAQKQFKTFFTQNLKRFATEQRGYKRSWKKLAKQAIQCRCCSRGKRCMPPAASRSILRCYQIMNSRIRSVMERVRRVTPTGITLTMITSVRSGRLEGQPAPNSQPRRPLGPLRRTERADRDAVTGADTGNGRVRDLASRNVWVVAGPDGRRIGVKDSVASVCLTVGQSVKWRIPRAIGPDIVKNAVIVEP